RGWSPLADELSIFWGDTRGTWNFSFIVFKGIWTGFAIPTFSEILSNNILGRRCAAIFQNGIQCPYMNRLGWRSTCNEEGINGNAVALDSLEAHKSSLHGNQRLAVTLVSLIDEAGLYCGQE